MKRFLISTLLCAGLLAAFATSARAEGAVIMECLNSSGLPVPWWNVAGTWQCAGATLPVSATITGGSTSNASSGVATSSTNLPSVAYNYGFNGTTWDQLQVDANKFLKSAVFKAPSASSTYGMSPSATQAAASNSIFKGSPGNLYSITVTIGATSGWVMVFDATTLPGNGATGASMKWCFPVNSDGTKGGIDKDWQYPLVMATGIVIGFSSTACNSLTASATAFFYGEFQ